MMPKRVVKLTNHAFSFKKWLLRLSATNVNKCMFGTFYVLNHLHNQSVELNILATLVLLFSLGVGKMSSVPSSFFSTPFFKAPASGKSRVDENIFGAPKFFVHCQFVHFSIL